MYKNLQWVQIDAKELPLCILIFQNFHCVLGSISTFCIYMYWNFQCVLSFRIFQNLQCGLCSVYSCFSSVLEFPYYVGIYQDFLCILRFVRTYTVHWVVPRRRTWYVFYHSTRGLHWVATFGFLTTRRAWKGICMPPTKSWSLWYMNI